MFTGIVFLIVGVVFMVGTFFMRGVRGAFSQGPLYPASAAHKVLFFLFGLAFLIKGFMMLRGAHG